MRFEDCKVGQRVIANHTKVGIIRECDVYNGEILVEFKDMSAWVYPKYLEIKEMENYICINGKKTELTQKQLRQLGIETEEDKRAAWEIQTNLHMQLYKKLREFAFENGSTKLSWSDGDGNSKKWYIYYNHINNGLKIDYVYVYHSEDVYFTTREIAERAIEEVVEPFMKEHPEFKW